VAEEKGYVSMYHSLHSSRFHHEKTNMIKLAI
jgi:hypothetical protein